MDTTYQGFRAHYAQSTDDDLRQIAASASDLIEDARRALTEELADRGITNVDITANKADIEASNSSSGAITLISGIPWLFCMWNYYGDHMLLAPYDKQAMALSFLLAVIALHWEMRRSHDGRRGGDSVPPNNRCRGP